MDGGWCFCHLSFHHRHKVLEVLDLILDAHPTLSQLLPILAHVGSWREIELIAACLALDDALVCKFDVLFDLVVCVVDIGWLVVVEREPS